MRKCKECGIKAMEVEKMDSPWEDDKYILKTHCTWCGYKTDFAYYKSNNERSHGNGWHSSEAECRDRDFPKKIKHCGQVIKFKDEYYDNKAVYYCPVCHDQGWLNLWQDPDRTLTAQDIYWVDKYDCRPALHKAA